MSKSKSIGTTIMVGNETIKELRDWNLTEETKNSANGLFSAHWGPLDCNMLSALTIEEEISLKIYPNGNILGDTFASLNAFITLKDTASNDGHPEITICFESISGVTWDTV